MRIARFYGDLIAVNAVAKCQVFLQSSFESQKTSERQMFPRKNAQKEITKVLKPDLGKLGERGKG